MTVVKKFIAEKIFYSITLETKTDSEECTLELITGDDNNNSLDTILNALESINFMGDYIVSSKQIWDHIKLNWDSPTDIKYSDSNDVLEVTINKLDSDNGEFNYDGCELSTCEGYGKGNNIYECITYDNALHISHGEYYELNVCGECLCEYHNGCS